jgi:hypothetical protein
MNKEEKLFNSITEKLVAYEVDVTAGKMMSSPGLKYRNKVFAFYYKNEMIFRLGKDFKPGSEGIINYSLLNPFKNKPPLAGWFCISFNESAKWEKLANLALDKIRDEL